MANVKISGLPSATTPLAGTEVLPIVQGGVTDQVTVANLTAGRAIASLNITTDTYKAASSAGGTLQSNNGTACAQWGAGGGANFIFDGGVSATASNVAITFSPTGTGTVTISPATASTMNNVAIGGTTPLAGTFTAAKATEYIETSVAIPASAIDLATGNYFTKTISSTTTFTISNTASSGLVNSFILQLTNGGSATVNWFSGVKWAGGTSPTLTSSGVDVLGFYTLDGGTTWEGFTLGKAMA